MENSPIRSIYNLTSTVVSLAGILVIAWGFFELSTPTELLQRHPENLTLPPEFTFGIWGLIYFGFLAYSIYQLLPSQQDNPRVKRTETYITYSILLNFAWVLSAGIGMSIISYIILWMMLLVSIFLLFSYGVPQSTRPFTERFIYALFAMYAGWLTVVMFPFTTDLLLQTEWTGEPLTPTLVTIGIYLLATLIVLSAYRELKHTWFIFPLIWTMGGLSVKSTGTLAWITGSLALFAAIYFIYRLIQSIHVARKTYHSHPWYYKRDTLHHTH